MRDLVYYVATTLDGYIAREDGSFDDFPWDDDFGSYLLETFPETFPAVLRGEVGRQDNRCFDAVVMGRKTYRVGVKLDITNPYPTLDQYVVSTSMAETPHEDVHLISGDAVGAVRALKEQDGKDIWLCGGGGLASTLHSAGLIDRLIVKLNPIVFGSGIPLFAAEHDTASLELTDSRTFDSGHVVLWYRIVR